MPAKSFTSPDQLLTFSVIEDGGDVALGFEGFQWHTHGDLLAAEGFAGATTAEEFVQALLEDELVIAVLRGPGGISDIWITDDPAADLKWLGEGETVEHRHWSGKVWHPEQSRRG